MMMPSRSGMRTASRARTRSSIAARTSSRVAPDVAPAWRRADSTSSIAASSERTGASAGVTSPISVHCAA